MRNEKSIIQMAKGAIEERIDYEMTKIVENIRDESTKATAPRELTVKIKLTPDDNRETIAVIGFGNIKACTHDTYHDSAVYGQRP